jgi:hypothetical protein
LEPEQINLVYNEVFWKKQADAEIGLLGTYALYRGLMVTSENWYQRADATTGFIKRGWNGGSPDALYIPGDFSSASSTTRSWGGLESYADWSNFYKVVAQANLVIKKIEEIPDANFSEGSKDQLLGEAYFLRALVYFNILRLWGNAPYISESIESSTQVIDDDLSPIVIPRTDDIEIAKNVISDVNFAVSKLKYSAPNEEGWGIRANKGSAQALAGHANLWMHFLANRDGLADKDQYLSAAVKALEDLRTNGNYSYVDYSQSNVLEDLYKGGSSEAVFELNISYDQNESYRVDQGGVESYTCKLDPLDGDVTKDRASSVNFVPYAQKSLMYPEYNIAAEKGDIRANLFFEAWHSTYEDAFSDVSQTSTNRMLVTWMKKYKMVTIDPMHAWNEYVAYFAEANIPVFRYTDACLLLAEAYYKSNESAKAIAIVNEIRSRAGLAAYSGSNLLTEILQQRISELFGEGYLFFDMVRNNYFPNRQVMEASRYSQEGYYWPVSSSILTTNKLIKQTPYWNGKTTW